MKHRIFSILLAILISIPSIAHSLTIPQTFLDVPENEWFYPHVQALTEKKVISIQPYFRPNDPVTRAEFTKMLILTTQKSIDAVPDIPTFQDVPLTKWYAPYIEMAFKNQIVSGYRDYKGNLTGKFWPGSHVTRAEAVKMITVAFNLNDVPRCAEFPFEDVNPFHWAYPYIFQGYWANAIEGYREPDKLIPSSFGPDNLITRAQVAKILNKTSVKQYKTCNEQQWEIKEDTTPPEETPTDTSNNDGPEETTEEPPTPKHKWSYQSDEEVLLTTKLTTRPVLIKKLQIKLKITLGDDVFQNQDRIELSDIFDNLKVVQYDPNTPEYKDIVSTESLPDTLISEISNGQKSFEITVILDDNFIVPHEEIDPNSVQKQTVYWDIVIDFRKRKDGVEFSGTDIQASINSRTDILDSEYLK